MRKKNTPQFIKIVLFMLLSLAIVSCAADDGIDGLDGENGLPGATGPRGIEGPQGPQGPKGNDGLPGSNGSNGQNGIGFDELTTNGFITQEVIGSTSDNLNFSASFSYKYNFGTIHFPADSYTNSNGVKTFTVTRYYSVPFADVSEPKCKIIIKVENNVATLIEYISSDTKIKLSNNKYVSQHVELYEDDLQSISTITNYNFNSNNNSLSFNYSITLDPSLFASFSNNLTQVSGAVNVSLELFDNPI